MTQSKENLTKDGCRSVGSHRITSLIGKPPDYEGYAIRNRPNRPNRLDNIDDEIRESVPSVPFIGFDERELTNISKFKV